MKKIFLLLLAFMYLHAIQAQDEIVVDPNASLRTLPGHFNAIKISGGINLFLSQAAEAAIAVSASEDRYKEAIKTTIENQVLHIYYEGDKLWNSRNKKLRVYVSFKDLERINASGACDILVSGSITVSALSLQLSGACDFKGKLAVDTLNISLGGASDVRVSGTASMVNIDCSGASDVKGYELVTDYCHAKASGASDIHITVNKEMQASASGASSINYKGTGLIRDVHSSGSGKINRKGK